MFPLLTITNPATRITARTVVMCVAKTNVDQGRHSAEKRPGMEGSM